MRLIAAFALAFAVLSLPAVAGAQGPGMAPGLPLVVDMKKVEVGAVLDRWLAPDHRFFKVEGDDGAHYLLRHDEAAGRWELVERPG